MNTKTYQLAAIDVEEIENDQAESFRRTSIYSDKKEVQTINDDKPKKRRGRPIGSLAKTGINTKIQSTDFHFFRACIEKIDIVKAADRYLPHRNLGSRAAIEKYADKLKERIQSAINAFAQKDTACQQLEALMAKKSEVPKGITLDEFSEQFPEGMYSERELVELYVEQYGIPSPEGLDQKESSAKIKRDALNWLITNLSILPTADQPLGLWFEKKLVANLPIGILTLGNLVDWINLTGRLWHEKVPTLGRHRAKRILKFILQNETILNRKLSHRIRESLNQDDTQETGDITDVMPKIPTGQENGQVQVVSPANSYTDGVQVFGVVPIEYFAWPPELLGHDGIFRQHGPNTYGAENDRQALDAWFTNLSEKSPATQDTYRRAVERLVLWAIVERRCSLSSLTTKDFIDFREFLRHPPAYWFSKFPTVKTSNDWRPMRGPMGDASIKLTMSAISTLYSDLSQCGYLRANAVSSVRSSKKTSMRMDVMRSFADEDLVVIKKTMDAMPETKFKRRLRALLLLLQTTGMRRSEVANLKWGDLAPVRQHNKISSDWAATFEGKGRKERTVPIQEHTIQALQAHYQDRLDWIKGFESIKESEEPKDEEVKYKLRELRQKYTNLELKDTPVLSILDLKFAVQKKGKTDNPVDSSRNGSDYGALTESTIYMLLKNFFKLVASSIEPGDRIAGQADFLKASTHWMRHTFAHQALKGSNRDLPAVQRILGHSSIATTGIYTMADMSAMIESIKGVKGFDS